MEEGACVPEELRFYLEFSFIYNLKLPAWCIKKLARFLASGAASSTSKQCQATTEPEAAILVNQQCEVQFS